MTRQDIKNCSNQQEIRVRFAPSPTGDLHLGSVRTALYNWLYAKNKAGKFLLRIEDSDVERSSQEATDIILEGLDWLGLTPDEEPVFQSNRGQRHQEVLHQLLQNGHAYYCDCPLEMLDSKRELAIKEGRKPKYDGRCRDRNLPPSGNALRFRSPDEGETTFYDLIRDEVTFQNDELDDLIICRSNGTPTYNFLVVVDDCDMSISQVIRGEDHINNTPRQILIYQALNAPVPQFAHLPSVLGADKTRLSKRHGATSILAYRDLGYLPDGLINYIARLGWGHGDQEIFTRQELVSYFELLNVNKSAAVFDVEKLNWVNAQHIKTAVPDYITSHLKPFLELKTYTLPEDYPVSTIVELFKERAKTLQEIADKAEFLFSDPKDYDPAGAKKFLRPVMIEPFQELLERFQKMESFDKNSIQQVLEQFLDSRDLKLGKIAQPLRIAVTGKKESPGIYETLEAIGKAAVLRRMEKALEFMEQRAAAQ